jgi:mono/diheme cytochrome c family protein
MRRGIVIALACLGLTVATLGCGAGGGSSGAEGVSVSGTVQPGSSARAAGGAAFLQPVEVVAVDESGHLADAAAGVVDRFDLVVPPGHDYVLVFSDAVGVIGALAYPSRDGGRSEFRVEHGSDRIDLGAVVVDPEARRVEAHPPREIAAPLTSPGPDGDDDGIPDRVDEDDDNDGIPDLYDHSAGGRDHSRDHDNDGIPDLADDDIDGDGLANEEDERPRDRDNDGLDADRDGDGDSGKGSLIFGTSGCTACHGADGSGAPGASETVRGASPETIAGVLSQGEEEDGEVAMPPYPDLVKFAADLAAFLQSGGSAAPPPPTPADSDRDGVADVLDACPGTRPGTAVDARGCPSRAPNGQDVYDAECSGCHRLGPYDPSGPAPDLSGASAGVDGRFAPDRAGHKGVTLTGEKGTALKAFLGGN